MNASQANSAPPPQSLADGAFIDVARRRTHYHEAGDGPVMVFIHGSGPGVTAWANWRLMLPAFAANFRVLAPDLLGFGYSARPEAIVYGKAVWIDHLLGFIAAMGVDRCTLIGNSMGGALALEIASQRPDLIERLVLMGSTGIRFPLTPGLDAVWGYRPSEAAMAQLIGDYFVYDRTLAGADLIRLRYEASIQPGFQESYERMFPAPRQAGIDDLSLPRERIAAITAPTLLVHGREDRVIPLDASYALLSLLPNAQLHVFGKCGHWTQIERTAAFNDLVASFMARSAA